jgi:hypothetical protein
MKIRKRIKPRNVLVPLAKFKKAGKHKRSNRKKRNDERKYEFT